jgi:hypothetical protein
VALVNAVVQRRLSASSAFLIGLALVATVWVATQGQLTHYELTY